MEEALESVREAHQSELNKLCDYQQEINVFLQGQIKSLEEKNKKLSADWAIKH